MSPEGLRSNEENESINVDISKINDVLQKVKQGRNTISKNIVDFDGDNETSEIEQRFIDNLSSIGDLDTKVNLLEDLLRQLAPSGFMQQTIYINTKDYFLLGNNISKIDKLDNQEKKDIKEILKKSSDYYNDIIKHGNKENHDLASKQYGDIINIIKDITNSNTKLNTNRINRLYLEFHDLRVIASDLGVDGTDITDSISNKFLNILGLRDNNSVEDKSESFFEKHIDDMNNNEANIALEYLNDEYSRFNDSDDIDKGLNMIMDETSIDGLDNKQEVRIFQDLLIEKIIGNNNGFSGEYIKGFNSSNGGNYIVKISDFSEKIQTTEAKDINSEELKNYFLYIEETQGLTNESITNNFSTNFLSQLGTIWEKDGSLNKVKLLLEKNNIDALVTINKIKDKTIEQLEKVSNSLNKISEKSDNWFHTNPEYISIITDKNKLKSVLELFVNEQETIRYKNINESLKEEFITNPGVELSRTDILLLPKNILESKLDKLIKNINGDNLAKSYLILQACNEGLDKSYIQEIINNNEISIYYEYINIYLGNIENKIDKKDFNNTLMKYSTEEDFRNLSSNKEDSIIITNFLLQNKDKFTDNEEYIIGLMELGYMGEGDIFNEINLSDKYTERLLKIDIINIHNINNINNDNLKNTKDIPLITKNITTISQSLSEKLNPKDKEDKNKEDFDIKSEISDVVDIIKHINQNTGDINNVLQILKTIKGNNGEETYSKILSELSSNNGILNIINLLKKSSEDGKIINVEYKPIYQEIESTMMYNLEHIEEMKTNMSNLKEKNIGEEGLTSIGEQLNNKLIGLSPESKKLILEEIVESKNKSSSEIIGKIYGILKIETNGDKEKLKEYLKIISKNLKEYEYKKGTEAISKIDTKNADKSILIENEEGKDIIDRDKLEQEYINGIEGLNDEEKVIYKQELVKKYFSNSSEEEIKNISSLFESIDSINNLDYIEDNIDEYVEYMELKENNPELELNFKEFKKENEKNNISGISDSIGEEIDYNSNYFTNEQDYIKTGDSYTLETSNGVEIKGLTQEEMNNTLGNPEATENLINFYTFFKELNLEGVWEYRKELIIAIGDVNIDPNDSDSIKDSELVNFGNKLLTFINNVENEGEKKSISLNNIDSVNKGLRDFSGAGSMLNDSKTFNIEGEDKFTAYLRNKGIIGGAYFKINTFRKYL